MESTYYKITRDNVNSLSANINNLEITLPNHIENGGTQFNLRLCHGNIYLQRKCCECKKSFDVEMLNPDKNLFFPLENSEVKIKEDNTYNSRCICCQSKKDSKNLVIDLNLPEEKSKNNSDSDLCYLNIPISIKDKQHLKIYSLLQGTTLKQQASNAIKLYLEHIKTK